MKGMCNFALFLMGRQQKYFVFQFQIICCNKYKYKLNTILMSCKIGYINQAGFISEQLYQVGHEELQKVLHRSIGAITSTNKEGRTICSSGVLLSKNIVLVAASSLYNKLQKYQNDNIKFYLPSKGIASKYYRVESCRYSQYIQVQMDKKLKFDYALIKLQEEVGYDQFPQICSPCQKCLLEKNKQICLEIYGYPLYKNNYAPLSKEITEFILNEYGLAKTNAIAVIQPDAFKIGYTINTQPGQSGSPIVVNGKIIGIHIGSGNKSDKFNVGRLFDQTLIDNILKMCFQLKGKQFTIYTPQPCQHNQIKYSKFKEQQKKSKILREEQEDFYYQQENAFKDRWQQQMPLKKPYFRQDFETSKSLKQRWGQFELNFLNTPNTKILDQTKNIKELNLKSSNDQKFKLTQKDMLAFSKVELPCLTEMVLQNNRIKDEGLAIISENIYPQLKKIDLDDNAITINGIKSILYNKWNQKIKYNLYSVQTANQNGYHINVGQILPIMKKIVSVKSMNEVDYLLPVQKSKTLNAMNLLLQTPLGSENYQNVEKISYELQKKYKQKSDKDIYSISSVLIKLKQFYGGSLKFIEKSNIKSSLTSKIIFTGQMDQRVRFTKILKQFKNFHFSDFRNNYKKLIQFQAQYMEFLRKNYEIQTTDMTFDKIFEGSIGVDGSDSATNSTGRNRNFFQTVANDVKLFFTNLQLTQSQFDQKGNYQFPTKQKSEIQTRGGFPYYQPIIGKRFGIRVKDLYDSGNNNWLLMDGNKDQWAIAFHGVNYPTQSNKMRSIMNGRVAGNMLLAGIGQACRSNTCLKNGSIVGEGIYVSPYFLTSLLEYSNIQANQKFHLVLQCRAKPQAIKIASRTDYWVINNRQELRPYGIILFTDEDIRSLNTIASGAVNIHKTVYRQQQFTSQTWRNTYKQQYESFINRP